MPPHEYLIQKPLVAAVVRNDVVAPIHQNTEGTIRRLDYHDAGIEDRLVVSGGRHLGEMEEDVEVAEDEDVGVDEDDLVVVGELP